MTSIIDILENQPAETLEISADFSHQIMPKAIKAYNRFLEETGAKRYLTKVFISPTGRLHFEAVTFDGTPDVVENVINLEDELKYFIDTGVIYLRTRDIIIYLTDATQVNSGEDEESPSCQCDQMDAILEQLAKLCKEKPINFKKDGVKLHSIEADFETEDGVDLYVTIKILGTVVKVNFYTYQCGDKITAEELYGKISKAVLTELLDLTN